MGVEVVLFGIVVGRGGYHHEVGVLVGCCTVKSGGKVQLARATGLLVVPKFASEVFLNIFVLNGTDTVVDFLDFLGDYVHSCHLVML